ncbi:MAG: AIR carboxylase family protein, partial [Thermodesulfobacteriota bacterium]|nr:AIR carboxylase family protein [Thermodesulfobacteriota bacterium]
AGMAAHLAGVIASQTPLPVIGVPLDSSASPLHGFDALLSTVQEFGGQEFGGPGIQEFRNSRNSGDSIHILASFLQKIDVLSLG